MEWSVFVSFFKIEPQSLCKLDKCSLPLSYIPNLFSVSLSLSLTLSLSLYLSCSLSLSPHLSL